MSEVCLWVVATPIGHLGDLSPRAREVLGGVALIAAEDTRHSRRLLSHCGLSTPLVSLHEHNETQRIGSVLARLAEGQSVALISDAGTPLISDPGYRLVRAARQAGFTVRPVPGPCAAIAALSVAGLPSDRFVFEGFLPNRGAARRQHLAGLVAESRTLVFYESSHRIRQTLADCIEVFGADRPAVLARELTKLHETTLAGRLAELAERLAADAEQGLGEFVLLIDGAPAAQAERAEGLRVLRLLRAELPPAQAARLAAAITGLPRKQLYAALGESGRSQD